MQKPAFLASSQFWQGVLASLMATLIWWVGGRVLAPVWKAIAVSTWAGVAEWIHELGWLAFLVTVALWFVNRRPHHQVGRSTPMIKFVGTTPSEVGLVIHSAEYGLPGHEIDVTDHLRGLIKNDRIDVLVKNELWGGRDPIIGKRKRLRVAYSMWGEPLKSIEVSEKDRLRIPVA